MSAIFGNWSKGGVPGSLPPQPYLEWDARRPQDFDGTNWNATSRSKLRSGVPTIMELVNGAVYSQLRSCVIFDGTDDRGQCDLRSINSIFSLYPDSSATSTKFSTETWIWANSNPNVFAYEPPVFASLQEDQWLQLDIDANNPSGGSGPIELTVRLFEDARINVNPWEARWWHIICVVDGGGNSSNDIKIYLNGVDDDDGTYDVPNNLIVEPDDLVIGYNPDGPFSPYLNGAIGYFALYDNYAFTLDNALYRYNTGAATWNSNNDPTDDGSRVQLTTVNLSNIQLRGDTIGSYEVDWGDGNSETINQDNPSHNYSSAGVYTITITPNSNSTYKTFYDNNSDGVDITAAALFGSARLSTSLQESFYGCSNLTSISIQDTSKFLNLNSAFRDCTSLTSFPALSFPLVTDFRNAWRDCSSLTSFPLISVPNGDRFDNAWQDCINLTSFSAISFPNATDFRRAWEDCTNLTTTAFPSNAFDSATDFEDAWTNCNLSAASIENILVAIDNNGLSNGEIGLSGGGNASKSNWTSTANDAFDDLQTKGWTIFFNS